MSLPNTTSTSVVIPTALAQSYLETLLEAHDGNISAAARAAGIERMSIYKMIRRLGLDKDAESRATATEDDEPEQATDHK